LNINKISSTPPSSGHGGNLLIRRRLASKIHPKTGLGTHA